MDTKLRWTIVALAAMTMVALPGAATAAGGVNRQPAPACRSWQPDMHFNPCAQNDLLHVQESIGGKTYAFCWTKRVRTWCSDGHFYYNKYTWKRYRVGPKKDRYKNVPSGCHTRY